MSPDKLYIFGFHPHGVVPLTLFWLGVCDDWQNLFPGIKFSALSASVMHLVPLMRDVIQWLGCREVSKASFQNALRTRRNCLLIPGGQIEMIESSSYKNDIKVSTKHLGFIRMAIKEGADLVPVISYGEVDLLDNVEAPTIQKWFLKRVGIAIPHLPYGLLYLPIPRPNKVTVVVGTPIPVEHQQEPSNDYVKKIAAIYLKALLTLDEKYHMEADEKLRRIKLIDGFGNPHMFDD